MYSLYMTKKVLIIGGGVAGPVAAMALQQAGLDPVVYEAYGRGSEGVGAFLTLGFNGLDALHAVGLREAVAELGMDTPSMRLLGRDGRQWGTLPMPSRTVARTDLHTVLRDEAARRGVPVEYDKRLVDAERTTTGVRVQFADGTAADGDLLVGADGLRSPTRTAIDPNAPTAAYIGLLNTGGYAHGMRLDGEPGVANFVSGRRCFFGYFIHPDGGVWWFANPPSRHERSREELRAVTPAQWRARLNELFRDDDGPMLDIIAATEEIFPGWNTYDFPSVPRWHNDRMVIIGDAAHAASPSSGQGASMAIEDAVVLGKCLRDLAPVDAFAAFEAARRSRVERIVRHGRRSGDGKPQGTVRSAVSRLLLPMVMRRMAARDSLSWMYEHHIDWQSPVTAPAGPRGHAEIGTSQK